jgi:RNA polymerase sigma factor FliA
MSQAVAGQQTTADVEEMITAHLPLVGHLVREMLARVPVHVSREDLFSAGTEALITAARAFVPDRGTPFSSYAAVRVRGALLDELRGLDWASRSVRGKVRRVEAARDRFVAEHGRVPTSAELAELLETDVREVTAVHDDVQRAAVMSLQAAFPNGLDGAGAVGPAHQPTPEELVVDRERIGYLYDAVEALPERLRAVVEAYYFQNRPMAEIAEELGVTESRVSQLRAEATKLLRDGINAHLAPEQVTAGAKPDGSAARRRASYYAAVAAQGTLRSRLAQTTPTGLPVRHTA